MDKLHSDLFWLRNLHKYVHTVKVKKKWRARKQKGKVISWCYSFDRIHKRRKGKNESGIENA